MREISGIYGANVPHWSSGLFALVDKARFKWAVVRTDCDPQMARRLRNRGIEVILQMPDGFNQHFHMNPAVWVQHCLNQVVRFSGLSHIICLDNEPNLCQQGGSPWFAEQFCRWYRAVVALWRFHDPEGLWTILFPGLSPTHSMQPEMWFDINEENVRESDALAAHSYWPGTHPTGSMYEDAFHWLMHEKHPDKDIYILEYGSPATNVDPVVKALGYRWFIAKLPTHVKCACMFILGGTEEWRDWFLTDEMARILGEE